MTSKSKPVHGQEANRSSKDSFVFRPAGLADFKASVKSLAALTCLPHQACQEELCRLYGYSGLHEIQEVLKRPGEPGPYEDEFIVPAYEHKRIRHETDDEAYDDSNFSFVDTARDYEASPHAHVDTWIRVTSEAEFNKRSTHADRLRRLISRLEARLLKSHLPRPPALPWQIMELGLFGSPQHHRKCRERLGLQAKAAFNEVTWPVGMWGLLHQLFDLPYHVQSTYLVAKFWDNPGEFDNAFSEFHPAEMVKHALAVASPYVYLAMAPALPPEILSVASIWDFDEISGKNWTYDQNPFISGVYPEEWTRWVVEIATKGRPAKKSQPSASDEELSEITAYRKSPDESIAISNRFLSQIPNVALIARNWRALQLWAAAREVEDRDAAECVIVLHKRRRLEVNSESPELSVCCYIQLSPVMSEMDAPSARLWESVATFVIEPATEENPAVPFAVMGAPILCPSYGKRVASNHEFFDEADSYSQEFCTVAEVVLHDYLPSRRFKSIKQFCDRNPGKSFASPWLTIDSAYRGKRLTVPLFNLWLDTLNDSKHCLLGMDKAQDSPPEVNERLKLLYTRALRGFLPPGVLLVDVGTAADEAASNLKLRNYIEAIETQIPAELMQFSLG